MHGKDTDPSQKWYPWFAEWCAQQDFDYYAPTLPNASDPVLDAWVSALAKLHPDEDTILVGHSRGGVAVLRWLERDEAWPVKKVILLATNSGLKSNRFIKNESNHGFYSESGFDFDKITMKCDDFVIVHSHDDKWVPFEHGIENAEGLDAKMITLDGYGHFGHGVDEIPELLEELSQSLNKGTE